MAEAAAVATVPDAPLQAAVRLVRLALPRRRWDQLTEGSRELLRDPGGVGRVRWGLGKARARTAALVELGVEHTALLEAARRVHVDLDHEHLDPLREWRAVGYSTCRVVYRVPAGVVVRGEVEVQGIAMAWFGTDAASWRPGPHIRWRLLSQRQLDRVPLALPDPPAVPRPPVVLQVELRGWCDLPAATRSYLKHLARWRKSGGLMVAGPVRADQADVIRAVAAGAGVELETVDEGARTAPGSVT